MALNQTILTPILSNLLFNSNYKITYFYKLWLDIFVGFIIADNLLLINSFLKFCQKTLIVNLLYLHNKMAQNRL